MQFSKPDNWTITEGHDGLLFFAQRIEEMLYYYTIDLYRAPVLNTLQLANEYIKVYFQVENQEMPSYHLDQIKEEFINSFEKDIILIHKAPSVFCNIVNDSIKNDNKKQLCKILKFFIQKISDNYYKWCVDYLKEIIPVDNHKNEIERAIKCWLPELVAQGYSPEYIYHFTIDTFFKSKVTSFDVLNYYFDRFDFKKREYSIYLSINDRLKDSCDILYKKLHITTKDDGFFNKIKPVNHYFTITLKVSELDDYTAMSIAYDRLSIFLRTYRMLGNISFKMVKRIGMSRDMLSDQYRYIPSVPNGYRYNSIEEKDTPILVGSTEIAIDNLIYEKRDIFKTINNIANMHNTAIECDDYENGFTSLWSIFEMLAKPKQGESKIYSVIDTILPILESRYYPAIFKEISNSLKENLSENDYDRLLNGISEDFSENKRIAYLILLPQYNSRLEDLFYNSLYDFPVIRHKIYQLNSIKESKNKAFELLNQYSKRVNWHLIRLYRVRNNIIHSGESHKQIKILGEHLHTYIDSVITEIIGKAVFDDSLTSIDDIYIDTLLSLKRLKNGLNEESSIDEDCIGTIMTHFFYLDEDKID